MIRTIQPPLASDSQWIPWAVVPDPECAPTTPDLVYERRPDGRNEARCSASKLPPACSAVVVADRDPATNPGRADWGKAQAERHERGWRDKSGSPFASQVLERTCLSPCRAVGSRAAPGQNINTFNGHSGTFRAIVRLDSRR